MVKDKLPESTIMAKIQSGPVKFDLSPGGLALLRQANVSPNILRVMMAAEKTAGNPPSSGGAAPTAAGAVPGNKPAGTPTAAGTGPVAHLLHNQLLLELYLDTRQSANNG